MWYRTGNQKPYHETQERAFKISQLSFVFRQFILFFINTITFHFLLLFLLL